MKTAIYVEDGTVQLVLTPETEFEKNSIKPFSKNALSAKIFEGTFYDCRGGWVRQSEHFVHNFMGNPSNEQSLIIRIDEAQPGGEK